MTRDRCSGACPHVGVSVAELDELEAGIARLDPDLLILQVRSMYRRYPWVDNNAIHYVGG